MKGGCRKQGSTIHVQKSWCKVITTSTSFSTNHMILQGSPTAHNDSNIILQLHSTVIH